VSSIPGIAPPYTLGPTFIYFPNILEIYYY
jgi:hypothetical protein